MIEKYYASHIKNSLDAAAINIMKPRKKKKSQEPKADHHIAPDTDV